MLAIEKLIIKFLVDILIVYGGYKYFGGSGMQILYFYIKLIIV